MDENTETAAAISVATLRALLLHRLSSEEAGQIEQRLLAEPGLAESLQDEEYALLDAYAASRLTPEDRAAVEQYLLQTAADRQRLRVAMALNRHAQARTSAASQRPARRRRMKIAGLFAAGCAALAVLMLRSPSPSSSSSPVAVVQTPVVPAYTLTLLASVERGAAPRELHVPAGIASVRVQAEIEQPEPDARYRLSVSDEAGKTLYAIADLARLEAGSRSYVEAVVPGAALQQGVRHIRIEAQAGRPFAFDWTVQSAPLE